MSASSALSGDSIVLPELRKRKRKEQAAAGDLRAAAGSAGSSRASGGGASESGAGREPEPVRYRLAYIPARIGQSAVRPCQQRPGVDSGANISIYKLDAEPYLVRFVGKRAEKQHRRRRFRWGRS